MERLIQGRIIEVARDSQNVLHIHFRKGLYTYALWAIGNIANTLEEYNDKYGAFMEITAKPIQLRFNDVTDEVIGIVFINHSV